MEIVDEKGKLTLQNETNFIAEQLTLTFELLSTNKRGLGEAKRWKQNEGVV